MTLRQYMEQYYSPSTIGSSQNLIRHYLDYMKEKAETATYKDVLDYIGRLRKKQAHPKTLRHHLFSIKIYYRWLVSEGQRTDHPCQTLNLKDKVNKSIAIENLYSQKQLDEFFESTELKLKILWLRDKVIVSLLIYQALNVSEITELKLADLDLEKGTIQVKGGVNTRSRTLHMKSNQIMLLHRYMNEDRQQLLKRNSKPTPEDKNTLVLNLGGSKMLPFSINRQINQYRPAHQRIQPLKIRQSVIANLLKQGHDLRVVQVFAGHRKVSSTEEYKQSGLEELKAVVQKYHPLQ